MMTHHEYRKHVEKLGMTIRSARYLLGVSERSTRRFAAPGADIPLACEFLLRVMVAYNVTPEDVFKLAKLKPPQFRDGRYDDDE